MSCRVWGQRKPQEKFAFELNGTNKNKGYLIRERRKNVFKGCEVTAKRQTKEREDNKR